MPAERVEGCILLLRGEKVLLDADLATLYGVETKALTRAVRRNLDRFPSDFMFQLSRREFLDLRRQLGTSRSWGGRRYRPYVFTEQGVAMLSGVLQGPRAVAVNVAIMRAFVRLRKMIASNRELARRMDLLESKYDARFKAVFDTIRELMVPLEGPSRRIGFRNQE